MNVLIIAYNRPDICKKLVEVLERIRPENIFISCDGPKPNDKNDFNNCREVQKILESFNWNCKANYRINKSNLGCRENVMQSISWFFNYVDEGIILEDDCIPDLTFFRFTEELLEKYRTDKSVFMISGTAIISSKNHVPSYRFTRLVNIWGWATWKRSWLRLIKDLEVWPSIYKTGLFDCYGKDANRQEELINSQYLGQIKLKWGTLWRVTCLINKAINIAPTRNLIKNIGFNRQDSTNTFFKHPLSQNRTFKMEFPLKHPTQEIDNALDERSLIYYYFNINKE